jgi:wyosine [tRNA(Phe)-imidazoG37] synthetase (radical SAM superfamily)
LILIEEMAEDGARMKYVFGPVPSKRLGQSLGIDPIPLKTCNWNCVYCQLGRSVPLCNQRGEFFARQGILDEIRQALQSTPTDKIDWVTFVGSGETTLHSGLGWLIRQTRQITSLPIAVITNGSLLYLPEVRGELLAADSVLPTLDAGNASLYRRINRPWPRMTFERLVSGLEAFRREYNGRLWLEVMLVEGLNDSPPALVELAAILKRIHPEEVQINLPTRPPAEAWVLPASRQNVQQAQEILGTAARILPPPGGYLNLGNPPDIEEAILNIITRHPMREEELLEALDNASPGAAQKALESLASSGQAKVVKRYGIRFWSAASTRHPSISLERRWRGSEKPGDAQ